MATPNPDQYCRVSDMVSWLLQERQSNPKMKLAFCFEGGGAKGCYQAGIMEGLAQLLSNDGSSLSALRPDILAGTSVGAIVSYSMWLELMYPGSATSPYKLRQSSLWQSLANGGPHGTPPANQAAEQLLSPGILIDYASGQKPIPYISSILSQVTQLQADWNTVKTDLSNLGTAFNTLNTDVNNLNAAPANVLSSVSTAFSSKISTDLQNMLKAMGSITSTPPNPGPMISACSSLISDLGSTAVAAVEGGVAQVPTLINAVEKIVTDVRNLAVSCGNLSVAANLGTGDAVNLAGEIAAVVAAVVGLLEFLAYFFTIGSSNPPAPGSIAATMLATNVLSDHVLGTTGLRNQLLSFLTRSPNLPAGGTEAAVLADWLQRENATVATGAHPELYLTGTSLTNSRLVIFAVGPKATLASIADDSTWVVDLAHSTAAGAGNSIFFAGSNMTNPLTDSVMASAALPVAFPPVKWTTTNTALGTVQMTMTDGGVMDSDPIDVAIQAGATHVISFELDAIFNYDNPPVNNQSPPVTMIDVYTQSFEALMTRVYNESIQEQMKRNVALASTPASQIPIFRLGPITQWFERPTQPISQTHAAPPGTTGVAMQPYSFLDFNGHWEGGQLIVNLEDRFMQGYEDVMLLKPPLTMTVNGSSVNTPGLMVPPCTMPAGAAIPTGGVAPSAPIATQLGPALTTADAVFNNYMNRALTSPGIQAPTGRVSFAVANMVWMAVTKASPSTQLT